MTIKRPEPTEDMEQWLDRVKTEFVVTRSDNDDGWIDDMAGADTEGEAATLADEMEDNAPNPNHRTIIWRAPTVS